MHRRGSESAAAVGSTSATTSYPQSMTTRDEVDQIRKRVQEFAPDESESAMARLMQILNHRDDAVWEAITALADALDAKSQ